MSGETMRRNQHGVKDSTDCWRTIHGEKYVAWRSDGSADIVAAYRRAGIKCIRLKGEIFVREVDQTAAGNMDVLLKAAGHD